MEEIIPTILDEQHHHRIKTPKNYTLLRNSISLRSTPHQHGVVECTVKNKGGDMDTRMDIHRYFMAIAILAAQRSTCIRRKVGCVAVKDKHVIATGYNGAISGMSHCDVASCYRTVNHIPSGEKLDLCYAVHAEQNVICQAAMHGVSITEATIYITTTPCLTCLKLLGQVGVKDIYCYSGDYPQTELVKKITSECGITICTDYYKNHPIDFTQISL